MKGIIIVLLTLVLSTQLVGCGKQTEKVKNSQMPPLQGDSGVNHNTISQDEVQEEILDIYTEIEEEYLNQLVNKNETKWNELKGEIGEDIDTLRSVSENDNLNNALKNIENLYLEYGKILQEKGDKEKIKKIKNELDKELKVYYEEKSAKDYDKKNLNISIMKQDIFEVYRDIEEEYLEMKKNYVESEWDEEYEDLKKEINELKAKVTEKELINSISDLEDLLNQYNNVLKGTGDDSKIDNIKSSIKKKLGI
ncbi:hypothetical protein [Clostridium ihumii]|uniref:hypothetical protein n=1 Tax=Clostridium ihumii TaxID=1470356 RepID=UPI000590588F|nr:hypothetical protein [Clostridium ihumii]